MWVLRIFCLCSSQLLKDFSSGAWRRNQARGNPWDMMVQRKTVPCCLPPLLESLMYLPVPPVLCTLSASGPRPPHTSQPLFSFPPVRDLTCFSSTSFPSPAEETEGSLKIALLFLSLVSLFLIMPCALGEKPPYTWQGMVFRPHDSYSSSLLSTCTSSCLLILTVPPTALSKSKLRIWA